ADAVGAQAVIPVPVRVLDVYRVGCPIVIGNHDHVSRSVFFSRKPIKNVVVDLNYLWTPSSQGGSQLGCRSDNCDAAVVDLAGGVEQVAFGFRASGYLPVDVHDVLRCQTDLVAQDRIARAVLEDSETAVILILRSYFFVAQ